MRRYYQPSIYGTNLGERQGGVGWCSRSTGAGGGWEMSVVPYWRYGQIPHKPGSNFAAKVREAIGMSELVGGVTGVLVGRWHGSEATGRGGRDLGLLCIEDRDREKERSCLD